MSVVDISQYKIQNEPYYEAVGDEIALYQAAYDVRMPMMLKGPTGQQICLNAYYDLNDFFKGENYSGTVFDDEAELAIEQGIAPFTGRFRPKEGNFLSTFDDTDAFGQWRLCINDLYHKDSGYLENFELRITVPEPASFAFFTLAGILMRRRR